MRFGISILCEQRQRRAGEANNGSDDQLTFPEATSPSPSEFRGRDRRPSRKRELIVEQINWRTHLAPREHGSGVNLKKFRREEGRGRS